MHSAKFVPVFLCKSFNLIWLQKIMLTTTTKYGKSKYARKQKNKDKRNKKMYNKYFEYVNKTDVHHTTEKYNDFKTLGIRQNGDTDGYELLVIEKNSNKINICSINDKKFNKHMIKNSKKTIRASKKSKYKKFNTQFTLDVYDYKFDVDQMNDYEYYYEYDWIKDWIPCEWCDIADQTWNCKIYTNDMCYKIYVTYKSLLHEKQKENSRRRCNSNCTICDLKWCVNMISDTIEQVVNTYISLGKDIINILCEYLDYKNEISKGIYYDIKSDTHIVSYRVFRLWKYMYKMNMYWRSDNGKKIIYETSLPYWAYSRWRKCKYDPNLIIFYFQHCGFFYYG
eukprot:268751_1